jgi:hypothetical protein
VSDNPGIVDMGCKLILDTGKPIFDSHKMVVDSGKVGIHYVDASGGTKGKTMES